MCEKVIQHGWGWKAVRFASLPVAFAVFTVATVENRSAKAGSLNLTEPSHASNCSNVSETFCFRDTPGSAACSPTASPRAARAGGGALGELQRPRAVREVEARRQAAARARAARELQRRDAAQPGREAEHRVPPRAPRFWRATHEGSARGGHRRHERRRASRADAPRRRRRKRARAGERRRTAGGRQRRERVHGGRRVRRGPDVRAAADGVQHGSTRCSTRERGRAVRAGEPRARSRGGGWRRLAPPRGEPEAAGSKKAGAGRGRATDFPVVAAGSRGRGSETSSLTYVPHVGGHRETSAAKKSGAGKCSPNVSMQSVDTKSYANAVKMSRLSRADADAALAAVDMHAMDMHESPSGANLDRHEAALAAAVAAHLAVPGGDDARAPAAGGDGGERTPTRGPSLRARLRPPRAARRAAGRTAARAARETSARSPRARRRMA